MSGCSTGVPLRMCIEKNRVVWSDLFLWRTNRCGHLAPLQDHVFDNTPVGVDVDTLVLVTQQHLHAIRAGQEHDGVWHHVALDLFQSRAEGMSPCRVHLSDTKKKNKNPKPHCPRTYMHRDINVVVISRVHVDGVESNAWTVDDLQPLTLLHRQVDQDGSVRQVCERLVSEKEKESMSRSLSRLLTCLSDPAERSKVQLPWKP